MAQKNQLQIITDILINYTAFTFASSKLSDLKISITRRGANYTNYMRQIFSGAETPTIAECENNAKMQFLSEYGKYCEMIAGFHKNGRLFILDRKNKIVLFLYKIDGDNISSVTHYNPLGYDCIEWCVTKKFFSKGLEDKDFNLSESESDMIKECDFLIANIASLQNKQ